jgi:6-methylsalicylate decarboxylase
MPLMELVDTTQVVFGTDFPFRSARDTAQGIAKYSFTDADFVAIDRGNAIRLMPTLA